MNELISIIVPVYNVEKYLHKCVESILNQTYFYIELILVDDGSTDTSPMICDYFKKVDERVRVIHKDNGGLSDARNRGIVEAKGKYLMFVDSDDYINNKMVEYLYQYATKYDADMTLCDFLNVYEDTKVDLTYAPSNFDYKIYNQKDAIDSLFNGLQVKLIVAWNKLYKKEIFETLCYEKGRIHEDEFIIHHIINKCSLICYIDVPLLYYLQRPESIMNKGYSKKNLAALQAIHNRYLFYKGSEFENDALILLMRNMISHYFKVEKYLKSIDIAYEIHHHFKSLKKDLKSLGIKQRIKFETFAISTSLYKFLFLKKKR